MEMRPAAPQSRQMIWAALGLDRLASGGMAKATRAATPLYTLKMMPTQLAPSLYRADVVSVVPYTWLVTAAVV